MKLSELAAVFAGGLEPVSIHGVDGSRWWIKWAEGYRGASYARAMIDPGKLDERNRESLLEMQKEGLAWLLLRRRWDAVTVSSNGERVELVSDAGGWREQKADLKLLDYAQFSGGHPVPETSRDIKELAASIGAPCPTSLRVAIQLRSDRIVRKS